MEVVVQEALGVHQVEVVVEVGGGEVATDAMQMTWAVSVTAGTKEVEAAQQAPQHGLHPTEQRLQLMSLPRCPGGRLQRLG
jgi:hypothetical protein